MDSRTLGVQYALANSPGLRIVMIHLCCARPSEGARFPHGRALVVAGGAGGLSMYRHRVMWIFACRVDDHDVQVGDAATSSHPGRTHRMM